MESLWPQIEPLLAQVTKPARYIGGSSAPSRWSTAPTRCRGCWSTPTPTRSACPTRASRSSTRSSTSGTTPWPSGPMRPWVDMEAAMRSAGIPLFSVENHLPAGGFDVLAFNLSAELVYTNVLNLIDLAGVPVRAAERTADHPVVMAGGHCAFNPEPLADFVDCFVLGDGEEVVGEINEVLAALPHAARGQRRAVPAIGRSSCGRCPGSRASTCRPATTWPTTRRPAGWPGSRPGSPTPRPGSRSGPSPTWATGPTRASSWSRSSRSSTTGSTWSCSGAAPGAAASARRA